jgi:hypothetical protein
VSIFWEFVPILVIILVYLLVCRVGAILLTMTGLDQPTAQFQALSALTGTGFTTRASEMIVGHEMRRRIAMVLMVIGNLGLVGGVVALINIFRSRGAELNLVRAGALIALLAFIFWISGKRKLWRKLNEWLEHFIEKRPLFRKSTAEELLSFHDNYSIVEITVQELDSNVGKALRDSDFRARNILILSIERDGKMIPLPKPEEVIRTGDKLICYGDVESIATSVIQF